MKNITEYIIPLNQRKDYLDYKLTHPEITTEQFIENGLSRALPEYDYKTMVLDAWKELGYASKLETIGFVMQFGKGHLNLSLVTKAFNEIKENSNE